MIKLKNNTLVALVLLTVTTPSFAQEIIVYDYDDAPAYARTFVTEAGIDPAMVVDNGIEIFLGDATGNGINDALVRAIYFEQNSVMNRSQLYQGQADRMVPIGTVTIFGQQPRDFLIEDGAFVFTTTVAGPNDQRCCPTQPQTYRVPFLE